MLRNKKYWLCQISGWFLFTGINLFYLSAYNVFTPANIWRILLVVPLGLIITELMRLVIMRLRILHLNFSKQVIYFLLLTIFFASTFAVASDAGNRFFGTMSDVMRKQSFLLRMSNYFYTGCILLLVWNLIYFLYHYVEKTRQQREDLLNRERKEKELLIEKLKNEKEITELKQTATEIELQGLRAQLNPHFMFNSLNGIQELILMEENEKSHSYLARFAKLLRMLLENADKPFVSLQTEIDFLNLYFSLETLRIPDLHHSIIIDSVIDTERTMIPNMMLQPYIENAIWHGLSYKQDEKKLQIRIHKEDDAISYEIEDNGVGRKKADELKSLFRKEHKSKGMELLTKRFRLLHEEFGADIKTEVSDVIENGEVGGTRVSIKVPASLSYEFV